MKLQKETVLIFIALLIGLLIVCSIFISVVTLTQYSRLEQQYMETDLAQAVAKLREEEDLLSSTASDWGSWDDAYDYVTGQKPDFEQINLLPETYGNLRLNLIIYTNTSGVVYAGAYGLENGTLLPVPGPVLEKILLTRPLADPAGSADRAGILMLPENPMIIASQPVARSGDPGSPAGVVIMGRYLDAAETGRLAALTRPSLSFARLDSATAPQELPGRISAGGGRTLVEPLSRDRIGGYTVIRDLSGTDALLLTITGPRDIWQQGVNTTYTFILIILGTGFFFGISVILILNRTVLSRLDSLNRQVSAIGSGTDRHQRVAVGGDDEFAELAGRINRMLETIDQTQDGLQASEEKYRALTENTADILISTDPEGLVTYVSPRIARFGFSPAAVAGHPFERFIHPEDSTAVRNAMAAGLEGNAPFTITYRLPDAAGAIHWIEERCSPQAGPSGKPAGIYGILRDVSDRKRAEDAIALANRKLNLMNQITRHDILNTITGLLGCVDMARATGSAAEREVLLSDIRDLTHAIQRQISFTREYQEVGVNQPQWQSVNGLLEKVVPNFAHAAVTITPALGPLEVYADPLLEKVFYNLIDNAVRYGETATAMTISAMPDGNGLCLVFEDNGVGVPEDQKRGIFRRGVGRNTGLGLFLSAEILAITGMTIAETGVPGKGARFVIRVPAGTWRTPPGGNA